jgi:hypothetical protein
MQFPLQLVRRKAGESLRETWAEATQRQLPQRDWPKMEKLSTRKYDLLGSPIIITDTTHVGLAYHSTIRHLMRTDTLIGDVDVLIPVVAATSQPTSPGGGAPWPGAGAHWLRWE